MQKILQRNKRMSQMLELISHIIKTKSTHPVPILLIQTFSHSYDDGIKFKSIAFSIENAIANQLQKSIVNQNASYLNLIYNLLIFIKIIRRKYLY